MITGGIIAAGHGERFKKAFPNIPKPLIEVAGRALLLRTVDEFKRAGIKKITIIFRKDITRPCTKLLKDEFKDINFEIISKDTKSSCESLISLFEKTDNNDKLLITTVDSIFKNGALKKFLTKANRLAVKEAIFLGVTSFIDDEKPLYVSIDSEDKITAIGKETTNKVTCGVYLMPSRLIKGEDHKEFSALRKFLAHLHSKKVPFYSIDLGQVIDVDRPEDLQFAEKVLTNTEKNLL